MKHCYHIMKQRSTYCRNRRVLVFADIKKWNVVCVLKASC